MATTQEIDFSNVEDVEVTPSGVRGAATVSPWAPRKMTPKQIRSRLRRRQQLRDKTLPTDEEMRILYKKPIEEWDLQELAHGRPRNSKGHFSGPKPAWVTIQMYEEAMNRYTNVVKTSMRTNTIDALDVLNEIITNRDVDDKGKPIVPANTRLDATKFLIEHVIGKPTQRIENEVSVKLQALLGQVMVNPAELATGNFAPAHYPGVTMALATGPSDDDDDLLPSEG